MVQPGNPGSKFATPPNPARWGFRPVWMAARDGEQSGEVW